MNIIYRLIATGKSSWHKHGVGSRVYWVAGKELSLITILGKRVRLHNMPIMLI